VLGIVIAAGACASSGTAAGDQTVTSTSTRPRTNVISTQEIRESTAPSVADLIRQVRPTWPTNVTLFVNNDAIADPTQTPNQLRNLSKNAAMEIRFYTKSEAQMKWSSRYQEVIQVITR
jgi:hypothetical protein